MILQQQLKEYFGEDYDDVSRSALAYIKTILNRPPLSAVKYQIFNNEGSGGNLFRKALCYIIEKKDVDEGLKAFSSYLDEEYSPSSNRSATHHTKWALADEIKVPPNGRGLDEGGMNPFGDSPSSPQEGNTLSAHSLKNIVKTNEELQFFTAYADLNNSIVGAAEALGWDIDRARRIYFRVYRRARVSA